MGNCSAGAQDSNAFKAQLIGGYIPQNLDSITYEGVFNEHYYKINPDKQNLLSLETSFGITNSYIQSQNQKDIWAACLIKSSLDGQKRNDDPIDVSLVLDISGSMSSQLNYNNDDNEKHLSKLDLAKQAIKDLYLNSLRQNDSMGLATFNTQGYTIQQLIQVSEINQDQFLQQLEKIQINGGTTLEAGLQEGINMFGECNQNLKQQEKKQKRIIMITDMLDMQGQIMDQMIEQASKKGVYVSIIGVGVSFNSSLAESVIKHRGCNYFSITNNNEMEDIVVKNFDYNFFPNAYNVKLLMETKDYEIQETYGTPFETKVQKNLIEQQEFQSITEINSCFPSPLQNENEMRGGLILMKLKKKENVYNSGKIEFILKYTVNPNDEKQISQSYQLEINSINEQEQQQNIIYSNSNIKKGILLQQYVEICKNIMQNQDSCNLQELEEALINFNNECDNYDQKDEIQNVKKDLKQLVDNVKKQNDQKLIQNQ